jgi:H+/Cl- antiporter ClcA
MADSPIVLYAFLGIFAGAIALGFYQTYATISAFGQASQAGKDAALTRLATGVGVGVAARGIGEGIGEGFQAPSSEGGRRKTKKGKRRGRKTYRKTK